MHVDEPMASLQAHALMYGAAAKLAMLIMFCNIACVHFMMPVQMHRQMLCFGGDCWIMWTWGCSSRWCVGGHTCMS